MLALGLGLAVGHTGNHRAGNASCPRPGPVRGGRGGGEGDEGDENEKVDEDRLEVYKEVLEVVLEDVLKCVLKCVEGVLEGE